jgi:hypothetical protein
MYKPGLRPYAIFGIFSLVTVTFNQSAVAATNTFDFPSRSSVAELTCTEQYVDHDGKAKIRHYRVMAKGPVSLPSDVGVEVRLTFDGQLAMQYLDQLKRARITNFQAANLDLEDGQLMHIKDYKPLYHMNLDTTLVSDKSLPLIATFKDLQDLRLSGTNIKGSGFENLNKLSQLKGLNLSALVLIAGAIGKIKPLLTHLLELNLARTDLTKEDCANLVNLAAVQHLDVGFNHKIDDSCVTYFSHLTKLQYLAISDTDITDKSLPILLKLPNLNEIVVRGKEFWRNGKAKAQIGHTKFIDVSVKLEPPAEVFEPLH